MEKTIPDWLLAMDEAIIKGCTRSRPVSPLIERASRAVATAAPWLGDPDARVNSGELAWHSCANLAAAALIAVGSQDAGELARSPRGVDRDARRQPEAESDNEDELDFLAYAWVHLDRAYTAGPSLERVERTLSELESAFHWLRKCQAGLRSAEQASAGAEQPGRYVGYTDHPALKDQPPAAGRVHFGGGS